MEFETLDSKIVKGIVNSVERLICWMESSKKKLSGRQPVYPELLILPYKDDPGKSSEGGEKEMLERLYGTTGHKSSLTTNALSLYHSGILPKREPKSHRRLRAMANDILEN